MYLKGADIHWSVGKSVSPASQGLYVLTSLRSRHARHLKGADIHSSVGKFVSPASQGLGSKTASQGSKSASQGRIAHTSLTP